MTNGAVSDAEAQRWAVANNRGNAWYKWAEAHAQPPVLAKLQLESLVPLKEERALAANARIEQPNCALYPENYALFAIDAAARHYFLGLQHPTSAGYALAANYPAGCGATAKYPDGHAEAVDPAGPAAIALIPGSLVHDPLLGEIWFADSIGNCDVGNPPPTMCRR